MSLLNRRHFLQASAAGLTALSASRVLGANDRIGVGLIGFGLIGRVHLAAIKQQPDAQIAAVCDVHRARVEEANAMLVRPYRKPWDAELKALGVGQGARRLLLHTRTASPSREIWRRQTGFKSVLPPSAEPRGSVRLLTRRPAVRAGG